MSIKSRMLALLGLFAGMGMTESKALEQAQIGHFQDLQVGRNMMVGSRIKYSKQIRHKKPNKNHVIKRAKRKNMRAKQGKTR